MGRGAAGAAPGACGDAAGACPAEALGEVGAEAGPTEAFGEVGAEAGGTNKATAAPGWFVWPGRLIWISPFTGAFGESGFASPREKIGITISQRFASWSYRTTASPLLRCSHGPPKPRKSVFVATDP